VAEKSFSQQANSKTARQDALRSAKRGFRSEYARRICRISMKSGFSATLLGMNQLPLQIRLG